MKYTIELDSKLVYKIAKLGHMNEIQPDLIKKLVDHAHVCDKWWLERDEDES